MKYNKTTKKSYKKYTHKHKKHGDTGKNRDYNKIESKLSDFGELRDHTIAEKPYSLRMNVLGCSLFIYLLVTLFLFAVFIRTGFLVIVPTLLLGVVVSLKLQKVVTKEILWKEIYIYEAGMDISHTRGRFRLNFNDIKGIAEHGGGVISSTIYAYIIFHATNNTPPPIEIRFKEYEFAIINEIFSAFLTRGLTQENIKNVVIYFDKYNRLVLKNGLLYYEVKSRILPLDEIKAIETILTLRARSQISLVHICSKISKDRNIVIPECEMMNLDALREIVRINTKRVNLLNFFVDTKE